jgi:16S rRNA (uracil1498-N3)-methyltransferase
MKEVRFFYVPDAATQTELPQEEATHALRVLRIQAGDELFLMDGKGVFYRAEVSLATNKRCIYEVKEVMPQQPAWRGHIHLAIAPTKMMDRIEWMAEKATEIGFDEISFLNCKFSERKVIRIDRIDKIVVSAVKQSHKAWKPVVNELQNFKDFITTPRNGRKFICHCYEEIEKKDFFAEISKSCPADIRGGIAADRHRTDLFPGRALHTGTCGVRLQRVGRLPVHARAVVHKVYLRLSVASGEAVGRMRQRRAV